MTETPTPQAAPLVAGRNPGPRPALSRRAEDDAVVSARPRVDGSAGATSASSVAGPAPASWGKPKAKGLSQAKSKDKDAKKAKDARKHKDKGKDRATHPKTTPPRATHDADAARDDKALVVSLPKPVRKALTHAASEHGTTPERLVALVISEWLDH